MATNGVTYRIPQFEEEIMICKKVKVALLQGKRKVWSCGSKAFRVLDTEDGNVIAECIECGTQYLLTDPEEAQ